MKNVIFDIGNVVLEWQPEHVIQSVFTVSDPQELAQKTFVSPLWHAYDSGVITTKELTEELALELNCPINACNALLSNIITSLRPIPEMLDCIKNLKQSGKYKLYALTNMPHDIFLALYEEYNFWHLFDDIIVSSKVKISKPDLKIYQHLLKLHGLEATECLFLDDSLKNVKAASALGFNTIKVSNPNQAIDELYTKLNLTIN